MAIEPGVFFRTFVADQFAGAATEAFDTERTGAREKIEHPCCHDSVAETIEDRKFDLIGHGSDAEPFGGPKEASCRESANDAHGGRMRSRGWVGKPG